MLNTITKTVVRITGSLALAAAAFMFTAVGLWLMEAVSL